MEMGFTFKPLPGNREDGASLLIGAKNVQVLLFEEKLFSSFSGSGIADTSKGNEVLFSIDAENMEEVDILARKVKKAGGRVFSEPAEKDGWMYGFGFSDPDGHRWSVLYMDMSKSQVQQQKQEFQVP